MQPRRLFQRERFRLLTEWCPEPLRCVFAAGMRSFLYQTGISLFLPKKNYTETPFKISARDGGGNKQHQHHPQRRTLFSNKYNAAKYWWHVVVGSHGWYNSFGLCVFCNRETTPYNNWYATASSSSSSSSSSSRINSSSSFTNGLKTKMNAVTSKPVMMAFRIIIVYYYYYIINNNDITTSNEIETRSNRKRKRN